MKTQYLSNTERKRGTEYFIRATLFNGMGFSFLAGTIVHLIAIHYGANNFHLGYISSLIHLSGIILLFIPYLLKGKDIVKVYSVMWFLRGVVCLLNWLTFLVTKNTALFIVLISYTLFCTSRMTAIAMFNPIRQMISTPYTRGEIVSKTSMYFNLTMLISRILSFLITLIPVFSGIFGLLCIQTTGVFFNSLSSLIAAKIPCREKVEVSKGKNIFVMFSESIKIRKKIIPLLLHWLYRCTFVLIGFIIPLLKRIIDFSQSMVFLYTIVITAAVIITTYLSKPFVDRIGSKIVIAIASLIQGILLIIWGFVKPETPHFLFFILGFFFMSLKGIHLPFIGKLIIQSMPQKDKISYNSMLNFFSAVFTFAFGMIAGLAGDIGEKVLQIKIFNPYFIIFFAGAFLSFVMTITSLFIKETHGLNFKQTKDLFLSITNLKDFIDTYHLDLTADPHKRSIILMSLKYSHSSAAIDMIRGILKNPLTIETEEVLKSLFSKPRPQLLPEILNIACDKNSYRRSSAIFALGAYQNKKVEEKLLEFLDDHNSNIQSTAAKSLARIGNRAYLDKIVKLSKNPHYSTWVHMNYLIARGIMDEKGTYLQDIFTISDYKEDISYKQAIFSLTGRILSLEPPLNELYQGENIKKTGGLIPFLEETKQLKPFIKNIDFIKKSYLSDEFEQLWEWCKKTLRSHTIENSFDYLKKSIIDYNPGKSNSTNTFAALYYTFQILLTLNSFS